MKGITPVIAIILLLLMTVAAAGGFYFFYQRFTGEGEDSGTRQVDQLGEQALARLSIESAAGGRIYIRNTGATSLNLEQTTLYVENVPISADKSKERLGEREMAVLKLTELPACTTEKCEVRISGPASVSRTIDLSRLLCSADGDCYLGEICESGLCVSGGCGDGICGEGEDGMNCFEDCGPRLFPIGLPKEGAGDLDLWEVFWNGETFAVGEQITDNELDESIDSRVFYDDNVMGTGVVEDGPNQDIFYALYDGESWTVDNVTENPWRDRRASSAINFEENIIVTWISGNDEDVSVAVSHWDGSSWSAQQNISDAYNEGMPDIAFSPDDTAVVVWAGTDELWTQKWVNYSFWDGSSWSEPGTVVQAPPEVRWYSGSLVAFDSAGKGLAAWVANYTVEGPGPSYVIQYSFWEDSVWSSVQNVSDLFEKRFTKGRLLFDGNDNAILMTALEEEPGWAQYSLWDGEGWSEFSNLTNQNLLGATYPEKNDKEAIWTVIASSEEMKVRYSYWNGERWVDFEECDFDAWLETLP